MGAVAGAGAGASASDEDSYGGAGSIAAAAALDAESGISGCGSDSDVGSRMMSSSEVVELVGMFDSKNNNRGEGVARSSAGGTGKLLEETKAVASTSQSKEGLGGSGVQDS